MGFKVAFLGLGVMGYPMAGHLAKAGHEVTVYNRSSAGNPPGSGVPAAALEQTAAQMEARGGFVLVSSLWTARDMS